MEIDQTLDLKYSSWHDKLALNVATLLFTLLIVLIAFQVTVRNFNVQIQAVWTEPVSRFLFIVGTYFGSAVASRNREHIKMNLVLDRIDAYNHRLRVGVDLVGQMIVVVFAVIASVATFVAAIGNFETAVLGGSFSAGHLYSGMFIAFFLMLVYESWNAVVLVQSIRGDESWN